LIEVATQYMTLEPGDVLLTGTPAGCAVESGRWLRPGDVVSAEIETLGTLEVKILPSSTTN
jgi:2-keto-4-pentenoate hydratase/2-oxohepta-3-ene-1,7-dioic acid hydratase in catechol pathway